MSSEKIFPPISIERAEAFFWKAQYFEALRELTKANRGIRRLKARCDWLQEHSRLLNSEQKDTDKNLHDELAKFYETNVSSILQDGYFDKTLGQQIKRTASILADILLDNTPRKKDQ